MIAYIMLQDCTFIKALFEHFTPIGASRNIIGTQVDKFYFNFILVYKKQSVYTIINYKHAKIGRSDIGISNTWYNMHWLG